ncbi:MAG: MFS transporter [Actinocatenispora sp.]
MTGRAALLRGNTDFSLFWWGQALSALGSRISDICLPLLVLHVSHSALLAGAIATVRLVVLNVARLPGGVLADRWRRRTVLVRVDLVKALLWVTPAVLLVAGATQVWPLLVVAGLDGLVSSVYNPSLGAALRRLVRPDEITAAVSLNESRSYAAGLIGPAVGGALFALTPWLPFALDAVTFLLCAVLAARIGRELGGHETAGGMLAGIRTGIAFIARQPFLRVLTVWSSLLNFATGATFFGLIPLLRTGGAPAQLVGAVSGVVSVGALFGALAAPRIVARRPYPALVACGVAAAVLVAAVAVLPHVAVVVAGLTLLSTVGPVLVVVLTAQEYRIVPDELMGRVQSAMTLVGSLLYPFGFLTMGWLLQRSGAGLAYGVMAGVLAVCAVLCLTPAVRAQFAADPEAAMVAEPA